MFIKKLLYSCKEKIHAVFANITKQLSFKNKKSIRAKN